MGAVFLSLRDGTKLILNLSVPYELYTGVAPGIPPKGDFRT